MAQNGKWYKLEHFAVLKEFRKHAIGKELVKAVLADLPLDAHPVYLNAQITAIDRRSFRHVAVFLNIRSKARPEYDALCCRNFLLVRFLNYFTDMKHPFNLTIVLNRIEKTVASYPKAAMFELPFCSICPVLEYCQQVGVTKHR